MVLFVMDHISSLYQILAFRYLKHHDEEAILLMSERYREIGFLKNMEGDIFRRIAIYNYKYRKDQLKEPNWELQVEKDYEKIFDNMEVKLTDFSAIYCTHDIYQDFLYYCVRANVCVNYIEPIPGHLSRDDLYSVHTRYENGDPLHEKFTRKYDTLLGRNSRNVKVRYVFKKELEKDIEINMIDVFYKIDNDDIKHIEKAIAAEGIHINESSSIFLFQSSGWACVRSKADVYFSHAIICDTYLKNIDDLLIKDHPNNSKARKSNEAKNLFKEFACLPADIPLELIILAKKCKFNKLISCASTGNDKLKGMMRESIKLGDEPYYYWPKHIKLMMTYEIESFLGGGYEEYLYGIPKQYLVNYRACIGNPFKDGYPKGTDLSIFKEGSFTVVDKIDDNHVSYVERALTNAGEDSIVVFWNTDLSYAFVPRNKDLLKNFVTIKISKTALENNLYPDIRDEYLYFFVKNQEIQNRLKHYVYDKVLKYTKCNLYAETCRDSSILELQNERKRRVELEKEAAVLKRELQEMSKQLDLERKSNEQLVFVKKEVIDLKNKLVKASEQLDFERNDIRRLMLEDILIRMDRAEWRDRFYNGVRTLNVKHTVFYENHEGYTYLCALLDALIGNPTKNILEIDCGETTKLAGLHSILNHGRHKVLESGERERAEFFVRQNKSSLSHTVIQGSALLKQSLDGDEYYVYSALEKLDRTERYGIILLKYPRNMKDAPVVNILSLLPGCLEKEFIILMPFTDRSSDRNLLEKMEELLKEGEYSYRKIFYKESNIRGVCILCSEGNRYRFER